MTMVQKTTPKPEAQPTQPAQPLTNADMRLLIMWMPRILNLLAHAYLGHATTDDIRYELASLDPAVSNAFVAFVQEQKGGA